MDAFLFSTLSHMIIMTPKVVPRTEKLVGILIKESSIKAIGMRLARLMKSSTDKTKIFSSQKLDFYYSLNSVVAVRAPNASTVSNLQKKSNGKKSFQVIAN
jgi:hypothetical protein